MLFAICCKIRSNLFFCIVMPKRTRDGFKVMVNKSNGHSKPRKVLDMYKLADQQLIIYCEVLKPSQNWRTNNPLLTAIINIFIDTD